MQGPAKHRAPRPFAARRGRLAPSTVRTAVLASVSITLLPLLAATPPTRAAGTTPQTTPTDSGFTTLELTDSPDFPGGKMAVVTGEVGAGGQRFRLGGLTVMQPVLAYVAAPGQDLDVRMTLLKPGQEQPALRSSTGSEGWTSLGTRTWGGLDVLVEGPEPSTRFALVVWVSDELQPELADVVVTPAQFRTWAAAQPPSSLPAGLAEAAAQPQAQPAGGGAAGSQSNTLLLVLGAFLAGGLLVLITVLVMRRRP